MHMQTLRVSVILFFVLLALGIAAIIGWSVLPYIHVIGTATLLVILFGLACGFALLASFTWCKIGMMFAERRRAFLHANVISVGDVVAYPLGNGEFVHLSAMHEQAKVPQLPAPQEEEEIIEGEAVADDEFILDLWSKGLSLRKIVETTGRKYHEVQTITSKAKK
jgi:hypothetical protein